MQFHALGVFVGDYEGARYVHFLSMALLVAFSAIHVAMVLLVPRSLPSMLTGRIRLEAVAKGDTK